MRIQLALIKPSPHPIRSTWDEDKLNELAQSLKEQGQIVPIKVRPAGVEYEIVYGHRRVEAARRVGLTDIEAIIEELDDFTALLQQIMENESKEDVPYQQKAEGYESALNHPEAKGIQIPQLARLVGVDRSTINLAIRWLKEFRSGTAVQIDRDLSDDPRSDGVSATLEIARVLGDDTITKRAVAGKVSREGLTRTQTRQVAESVKAAPTAEAKANLIQRDFNPIIHDPELIRERAREFGANDPLYKAIPIKASPSQDWQNAPEVINVISTIKAWSIRLDVFREVGIMGKMSPEAKHFIARRVRQFANRLIEWAEELENG